MKKPTASNSLDKRSSNFQSSISLIISFSENFLLQKTNLFDLLDLFSNIFLVFRMKFGIESKSDCRFLFILSNAPALTKPSNCKFIHILWINSI